MKAQFMKSPPTAGFHFSPITSNEVCQTLGSLKNSAPGFDNVNAELLQVISDVIAEPLTHIFNLSFSNRIVPQELKTAKIIPIYKGEDPTIFTNYRPVSLLPTISKILEKLSYNRLLRYLDKNDILFQHQYGFRTSGSTYMAITHLTNELYKAKDKNQSTKGIFLVLSKAFDTVNHHILLQKLKRLGLDKQALFWFTSYLEHRLQFVAFKGVNSSTHVTKCGVPQRSVLGPLLYLIYINDLANVSDQISKILLAYDTSLF